MKILPNVQLYVMHDRFTAEENERFCAKTNVALYVDNVQYVGSSSCHRNDQFVKRVGVKMALKRAMAMSTLSKEARRAIWEKVLRLEKPAADAAPLAQGV